MNFSFVPSAPIGSVVASKAAICSFDGLRKASGPAQEVAVAQTADVTMMSCRRDLKKEKRLRNQQFARVHRKRVVKHFNRRAAQEVLNNADNDFLSSVYGTIRFRGDKNDKKDKNE